MTCAACEMALTDRLCALYHADCLGCQTRMLAQSPGFWRSRQAGALTTAYRDALEKVFGGDVAGGHARVKAEFERLEAMSAR